MHIILFTILLTELKHLSNLTHTKIYDFHYFIAYIVVLRVTFVKFRM
jgi:hypothetical protein